MSLPVTHKQNQAVTNQQPKHDLSIIEQVVMQGDLSKLSAEQRVTYYHHVCQSIGLNTYTRPFDYISLNGKLTLYAKKDETEQLRSVKRISITDLEGRMVEDLFIVKAKATTPDGRIDQATGAVSIGHLKGEAKANAIMKAETKAKRRVTLSISGLGWIDESELESIPTAKRVNVDLETGEIEEPRQAAQLTHQPQQVASPVSPISPQIQEPIKEEKESAQEPIAMSDECSTFVNKCFIEHGKPIVDYIAATCAKANKCDTQIWISAFNNQDIFFDRFQKWKETNPAKAVVPQS